MILREEVDHGIVECTAHERLCVLTVIYMSSTYYNLTSVQMAPVVCVCLRAMRASSTLDMLLINLGHTLRTQIVKIKVVLFLEFNVHRTSLYR
jgi:hypothetical protein